MMNRDSSFWRAAVLVIATVAPLAALAQTARSIFVESPQPVAAVAKELSKRHGILVSYEDPEYVFPGDLRDATPPPRAGQSASAVPQRAVLVPVGGRVTVNYRILDGTGDPMSARQVLADAIGAAERDSSGGRFKILESNWGFHIVPTSVRNRSGAWVPVAPLMDSAIALGEAGAGAT